MQFKLSFHPLLLATTCAGFLLPNPPGRHNVTLTTGTITDYSRDARKLMLSVFQPAICTSTVPVNYMPSKTAEHEGLWIQNAFNISVNVFNVTELFLKARLPLCPGSTSPLDDAPLLLLSPGYRGTRLYYNFIASAIASEGFTVITMDHPGETSIITYPDGHAVYSNLSDTVNSDDLTSLAYTRAADASFIIDQLGNATAMTKLIPRQLQTDRVVMAGHSLGGAAAVLAAGWDSRIVGAINWDGPFVGSLPHLGLSQPVLYVATERPDDARFLATWPELNGPKLWVKVAGLLHDGMLDFSTLLSAAGLDPRYFANALGIITPIQLVRILTAYTTEWTNGALSGTVGGPLLHGQEPDRFLEVSIVRKDNF